MRLVAYALGGGCGHVVRTQAVLEALGLRATTMLISNPNAGRLLPQGGTTPPESTGADGELPRFDLAPRELARDRTGLARWVSRKLTEHRADALLIDAFPAGVLGELNLIPELLERIHSARLLRWEAYAQRLHGEPLHRPDRSYAVEPLHADHARALGDPPPLALPPPITTGDARARGHVLVVHSGPRHERRQLHAVAARLGRPLHADTHPAAPLMGAAARVVTAGGFNAMREAHAAGPERHVFVPLPRPLDDQVTRCTRYSTASPG